MARILKMGRYDKKKEIEFEIKFLKSLSVKQRFNMMFKKTEEMINLLEKSGHRRPSQIIKRA